MIKRYLFKNNEYRFLSEIREKTGLVFPKNPDVECLKSLGIEIATVVPTLEEKQRETRYKRDVLLRQSDKFALVDNYRKLTDEQRTTLDEYRQALRDIPQQKVFAKNPEKVVFPEIPSILKEK